MKMSDRKRRTGIDKGRPDYRDDAEGEVDESSELG